MQKKYASLLSLIFQSIFVALSFVPIAFTESSYAWKDGYLWNGRVYDRGYNRTAHLKEIMYEVDLGLALTVLLLSLISIVIMILIYTDKKPGLSKYCTVPPLAAIVSLVVLAIKYVDKHFCYNGKKYVRVANVFSRYGRYGSDYKKYDLEWGFFIECALLITVIVLNILITRGKFKNTKVIKAKSVPSISNADELRKYKELFDNGVINQEEYDTKKKEILKL